MVSNKTTVVVNLPIEIMRLVIEEFTHLERTLNYND
jgi:hypothetical protein